MKNFPSMEELMAMPLYRLKLLDISTAEEEAMVQTAINAKVQNSPAPSLNKPLHIPDIKTVEEEKYWQGVVDAEREKLRPQAVSMEQIVPDASQVADMPEVKKRFCEHCDSKGVRHKKVCPTLNNGLQNTSQGTNN
jgi:hypothetical protein